MELSTGTKFQAAQDEPQARHGSSLKSPPTLRLLLSLSMLCVSFGVQESAYPEQGTIHTAGGGFGQEVKKPRRQVGGAQQGKHNCATHRRGLAGPLDRTTRPSDASHTTPSATTALPEAPLALAAAMEEFGETRLPELPRPPELPMDFLSLSWSASSLEVSKALAPPPPPLPPFLPTATIPEDAAGEVEDSGAPAAAVIGNPFSFASSATSQLVMERIMSQSEVSPLTSGRLSHSSGPLNGGGSLSDSPPVSPSDMDDVKVIPHSLSFQKLLTSSSLVVLLSLRQFIA